MERARGRRGGRRGAGEGMRRVKDCLRQFVAFMFSNVGIVGLVVGYAIAGAFIFMAIEGGAAGAGPGTAGASAVTQARGRVVKKLWDVTSSLNVFSEAEWREVAAAEVAALQKVVVYAALENGLETSPPEEKTLLEDENGGGSGEGEGEKVAATANQWSFSGAFLYSLTVITTIGYGNVSPQTEWGKLATIVYAIAGMPLFLLYLSNIGDILAKSFKWTYAQCCLCRWCATSSTAKKVHRHHNHHKHRHHRRKHSRHSSRSLRRRGSEWRPHPDAGAWPGGDAWPPEPETEDSEDDSDEDSESDSEDSEEHTEAEEEEVAGVRGVEAASSTTAPRTTESVTVPVSLCLAIMVGYVCGGAALFAKWEDWDFLDGSYFCFISLSTIGFGDIVPGDRITSGNGVELSFIFCSAYLMLGMALIAMCFSLMQEEVVHKMRGLVRGVKATARCICGTGRRRGTPAERDIALEPVNLR